MTSHALYALFIAAVGVERLGELRLSARNAGLSRARGGVEVGARHYPLMAAMHTLFLFSCVGEVVLLDRVFPGVIGWLSLGVAMAAQGLRYWAIATLGPRWNVRIWVVPGDEPVTGGPYRLVRHPNYVAVVAEMLALPLVHGAYLTAIVFSAANALVLRTRIAEEERALGEAYERAFAETPRFVPEVPRG